MAENKVVTLDLQTNIDQTTKSVGSLKSQLREAQNEVAALSDKFGATSKEAVEAAKRAGELKDKIGDAKALTDAFNPDAKFKAVSSSLAGVAGGFSAVTGAMGILGTESAQTEQMILKVQSAMAIASGLQQLGESADAFKQMKAVAIDAFKGIKTAIGSTGIGLLVIALGAIYTYWDDIKAAVSGVSIEQKNLNAISQKNVDQANEKLKAIGNQDNILKLQGKSEKEILAIKIKQTDEAITANKINIANQIQTNKQAEIGAKRNYDMLKSYIDFVSTPVRFLYENAAKGINKIIDLINKIPGVDLKYKVDEKMGDKAADFLTKLAFDPSKTKAEGEATIKASNDTLTKLLNDRAGYKLASQAIDKKESDDAAATQAEKDKLATDAATEKAEEKKKADQEAYDAQQKALKERNELELKSLDEIDKAKKANEDRDKTEQQLALEAENAAYQLKLDNANKFGQDITELTKQHANNVTDINQKTTDANIKIANLEKDAKLKALEETAKTLSGLGDLLGKQTTAGKVAAVASATIETFLSAQKAYSATVGIPYVGPFLAPINAGIAVAAGLKNVKSILSVQVPGGGGGGGSTPSVGAAAAPAAPSFNVVGNSGVNQIAGVMQQQGAPVVKTYVTAGDVTTAQSLGRNIISNATLS